MLGKKGTLDLYNHWPEFLAFMVLVIGFFIAALSGSAVMSYIIVFFCGMIGGRIWFVVKKALKVPWILILTGFLIGFILGTFYGDKRIIILSYLVGVIISYYLHETGYIKSISFG
jgi:uncharacterized membrane protein YjjP (DUF1212 family)